MIESAIPSWLERTELLIGKEAQEKLLSSKILLVGLGGVGSFAGEFLVRAGIGSITIIDGDVVDPTNKNRQLQALDSTVGQVKADLLKERFLDINPNLDIVAYNKFLEPEDMKVLLETQSFDFVLDCIDSIQPKLSLLHSAKSQKLKIISAMGAGGKLDPSKIKIGDISTTRDCKFAQQVKKQLKKKGIKHGILAVYSDEIQPKEALQYTESAKYKRSYYGTISYMPALFGLRMAAEVLRRLMLNINAINSAII
ncbi:MAG: tRNA threonylcarbamoyladenosine dehydratase [Saprospiraceae bacterium]|nr:tRNA threonylcarbamoyladenosine dehydratase [Saprospiraceae bacterium]